MADMLMEVGVPAMGCILAWVLGFSPIPGLLVDRKNGQLTTDPTPFPMAMTNALSWVLFACILNDQWLFLGNVVMAMFALFNTVTALRLCKDPVVSTKIERLTLGGLGVSQVLLLLGISTLVIDDPDLRKNIVGNTALVICIVMFFSPLAEAFEALKSGDGSKLSMPLAAASIACTSFWTLYGIIVGEFQANHSLTV